MNTIIPKIIPVCAAIFGLLLTTSIPANSFGWGDIKNAAKKAKETVENDDDFQDIVSKTKTAAGNKISGTKSKIKNKINNTEDEAEEEVEEVEEDLDDESSDDDQ